MIALWLAAALAATDTIRIPVQVDQQGSTVAFVTDGNGDVQQEAANFCSRHLSGTDQAECTSMLMQQVATMQKLRLEAQESLPGISFTVQTPEGQQRRFTHEEGANPAEEADAFCELHFSKVPRSDCVEAMLKNAQTALDEAQGQAA